MKTVKLTFIAAAAILLASCSSNKQETTSTDTMQIEDTYDGIDTPVTNQEASEEEIAEETNAKSNNDVDALLDEYEDYMDQTIKLVKKAQNGDMSAMTEYSSLLEKAQSLQKKLEDFKGEMTPAQASRLSKIAAKASQAMM